MSPTSTGIIPVSSLAAGYYYHLPETEYSSETDSPDSGSHDNKKVTELLMEYRSEALRLSDFYRQVAERHLLV